MRYARLAVSVIAVLMLAAAVPMLFSSESDAAHVSNDKMRLEGYALFDSENTTIAPQIYVFVVCHPDPDTYCYLNVNDSKMLSGNVNIYPLYGPMYKFSVEVPVITDPSTTSYYLYAFNSVKIQTVSSSFECEPKTIVPATDSVMFPGETWNPGMPNFTAYQLKTDAWYPVPASKKVMITGEDEVDSHGVIIHENADKITLKRAMGTVTGHVEGTVGSTANSLDDVVVEFRNANGLVGTAVTDSDGKYSITLPTGEYDVSFSRGFYKCDPTHVTVYESGSVVLDAEMTIDVDTQYFGYDLPHFLMIIGGVVCIFVIFISVVYQFKRIKKVGKTETEWILDDMPDNDEKN